MPTLTDEIKTFIVKGLACFDTPSKVAEDVNAVFGVQVTRHHVHLYDPACAQPPAERWRLLHAATRQALLADTAAIGITQRNVRLRMLDRMAHRCERSNVPLTAALLEQAAKECGGLYDRPRQSRRTQDECPAAAAPSATA